MAVAIVAPVVAAVVAPVPTPFPAGLAPVAAIVPTVTPPLPAILAPVLPCFAAIPAPLAIVLAQLALVARLVLGGLSAIAGDDVLRAAARYLATLANLPAKGFAAIPTTFDPVLPALDPRSEEHTSELQSLMRISYAVFCLKKKKNH